MLAHPLLAQEQSPRFAEELTVVEVLLDVVVTDETGSVILGLEADDFVVEEQGEPVELRGFSFYSNRRPLDSPPLTQPGLPPDERYFVLLFYRPPVSSRFDFRSAARMPQAGRDSFQWLVEDLLPNDYVAVVAFDGALNLVHDFSQDRQRLGNAIALASSGKAPKKRWPSRIEQPLPGRTLSVLSSQEDLRPRTDNLFDALRVLADGLEALRGRKVLILFGPSFPAAGSLEARSSFEPMVEALNTHNVAVYSIDVAGRGVVPTPALLAEETGGDYLHKGSDVLAALRDVERQNNGYYLLSYRSTHPPGTSGYRKVTVRTKNPEFRVRARSGYSFGDSSGGG